MGLNELFSLKGKLSIVTGGGRGLGLSISEALAEAGSDIILCSRRVKSCNQQAKKLRNIGSSCAAFRCDVTNLDDLQNLAKFALSEFGRVDILINSAGSTWGAPVIEYPLKGWNKVINVNVTGTFLCCQTIGKIMIDRKKGKIINLSSVTSVSGSDPSYMDAIAYNTSKGAINTFTKDLAVKWAPFNINVNAIAPAFIVSDMTKETIREHKEKIIGHIPLGRLGQDDDLTGAIIFLASDASDYITGQILFVDGGWHAF